MDYEFVVLCDLQNLPFLDSLIILSSVCLYTVCWLVFFNAAHLFCFVLLWVKGVILDISLQF